MRPGNKAGKIAEVAEVTSVLPQKAVLIKNVFNGLYPDVIACCPQSCVKFCSKLRRDMLVVSSVDIVVTVMNEGEPVRL